MGDVLPCTSRGARIDLPAEDLADALMAQAHPQQRPPRAQLADHVAGDPGVRRLARPRRDDDMIRGQRLQRRHGNGVVAKDLHLRAQLTEVLHQVVSEQIVVVDYGDHGSALPHVKRAA